MMKNLLLAFILFFQCLALAVSSEEGPTVEEVRKRQQVLIQKKLLEILVESKEDIIGVEMVIAGKTNDAIFSRYGHALLRFVNKSGIWSSDIMISFVADVADDEIEYSKGLKSYYQIKTEAMLVADYWKQYVVQGGRSLSRYIIPMSKEQIGTLIDEVKKRVDDPSLLGKYHLLTKNCATSLAQLLIDSGLSYSQNKTRLPVELPKWLNSSFLSPYPVIVVEEKRSLFEKAYKLLGVGQEDFVRGKNWPKNSAEIILKNFKAEEIKILYTELLLMPSSVYLALTKEIKFKDQEFDNAYSFAKVDNRLYGVCIDNDCALKVNQLQKKYWKEKEIRVANDAIRFLLSNYSLSSNESTFNVVNLQGDSTQLNHLNLLLENK